ncbi:hypothetical protein Y032_0577g222 [Ancylostoma ceylanicum]|uniref:Uncharacterized protein n=1 Tax=Ancylostoma ceylanicum TaxID=53326 RepID=A0A016WNM8_9BILA|nr:hypothetical protein Y032_0577g222 [Ancylostoma ceylanicum]
MKATLDKLMHAVQGIAKQNVAQVTVSVKTIHDRLLALRNVPSLLESQVDGGTRSQSRTGEELASLAEACIDGECGKIDSELEKLKEVEEQLIETVAIVSRILPSTINELLAQTEESGKNMQELAKLLRVDSTKVVERVKAMLQEVPTQMSRCIQVSQNDVLGPSTSRSGEASITNAQLNADEFRNVEYHLEFDPIAAAQGEPRGLQSLNPVLNRSNPSVL